MRLPTRRPGTWEKENEKEKPLDVKELELEAICQDNVEAVGKAEEGCLFRHQMQFTSGFRSVQPYSHTRAQCPDFILLV